MTMTGGQMVGKQRTRGRPVRLREQREAHCLTLEKADERRRAGQTQGHPYRGSRVVRCRQRTLCTERSTRCGEGPVGCTCGGMVATDVDRKCEWSRRPALDKPGGTTRAKDLVVGVIWPAAHSFEPGGGDVIRVPAPARAHTAPRRGPSDLGRWVFDGVFVLPGNVPVRASAEGDDGMT